MCMHQVSKKLCLDKSFYEGLEHVFEHFPKYHMKILVGDFNAKLEKERIMALE
jgi:ribulose bisphosphate carboxylase small subunit